MRSMPHLPSPAPVPHGCAGRAVNPTWAVAVLGLAALTGQWLYYRPDIRATIHAGLVRPLRRRTRLARRSLTALARTLAGRPYKPVHADRRTQP